MSVIISLEDEAQLYGRPVREEWRAVFDGDGGFTYNLVVRPGTQGSKVLFSMEDVPIEGVPTDIMERVDEKLEEVSRE